MEEQKKKPEDIKIGLSLPVYPRSPLIGKTVKEINELFGIEVGSIHVWNGDELSKLEGNLDNIKFERGMAVLVYGTGTNLTKYMHELLYDPEEALEEQKRIIKKGWSQIGWDNGEHVLSRTKLSDREKQMLDEIRGLAIRELGESTRMGSGSDQYYVNHAIEEVTKCGWTKELVEVVFKLCKNNFTKDMLAKPG